MRARLGRHQGLLRIFESPKAPSTTIRDHRWRSFSFRPNRPNLLGSPPPALQHLTRPDAGPLHLARPQDPFLPDLFPLLRRLAPPDLAVPVELGLFTDAAQDDEGPKFEQYYLPLDTYLSWLAQEGHGGKIGGRQVYLAQWDATGSIPGLKEALGEPRWIREARADADANGIPDAIDVYQKSFFIGPVGAARPSVFFLSSWVSLSLISVSFLRFVDHTFASRSASQPPPPSIGFPPHRRRESLLDVPSISRPRPPQPIRLESTQHFGSDSRTPTRRPASQRGSETPRRQRRRIRFSDRRETLDPGMFGDPPGGRSSRHPERMVAYGFEHLACDLHS